MQILFFVFLCQKTRKNKIISEKVELGSDRNEMEHALNDIKLHKFINSFTLFVHLNGHLI
jgi:hypothetical protein